MELRDYVELFRRRGWIIAAATALSILGAWGLTKTIEPTYETGTRLFVGAQSVDNRIDAESVQNGVISQGLARSYVEFAISEPTLKAAARRLGDVVPRSAVTASVVPDSQVLTITGSGSTPELATDRADQLAAALIKRVNGKRTAPERELSLIEKAQVPSDPVSPNTALNMLVGALAGLLLGYAIALAADRLDRRLRTTDEHGEPGDPKVLGLRVLGHIPEYSRSMANLEAFELREQEVAVEPHRRLAVIVNHLLGQEGMSVIAVTSPGKAEGKTSISSHLAISLAEAGLNTALLEADFRRPAIRDFFSMNGEVGIESVLEAAAGPSSSPGFVPDAGGSPIPNLNVFQINEVDQTSHRLASSDQMELLVDQLDRNHDIVIIDTPPLLSCAESGVLAQHADSVLMVTRERETRQDDVAESKALLRDLDVEVLGVVINATARGAGSYGYG